MSYDVKQFGLTKNGSFIKRSVFLLSICLASTQAYAHNPAAKAKKNDTGWSGKFSLGINSSVGNTNLNRLNSDILVKYTTSTPWQHTLQGGVQKAQRAPSRGADTIETKNINALNYKLDYMLDKTSAIAGYIGYEDDKKAKLEGQTMMGIGYEKYKMGTANHRFSVGLGVGHLDVKYTDGTPGFQGAALRASVGYRGRITDKISLREKIVILSSDDRTMSRFVTSLNYALTDNVSLALKNQVTHNNLIPATAIDKTDSITALNVVFSF